MLFNWLQVLGGYISWIDSASTGSRLIILLWIVNPNNLPKDTLKAHFKTFILRLHFLHLENTFLKSSICWLTTLDFTIMSTTCFKAKMQHIVKNDSHCALISGRYVFKTKQHIYIEKIAIGVRKILLSVVRIYFDLVIATKTIHKSKHRVTNSGMDQHVIAWQWKLIFWTCFVEVAKVCAAYNLYALILVWNYVG